jgi:hypothetical protein
MLFRWEERDRVFSPEDRKKGQSVGLLYRDDEIGVPVFTSREFAATASGAENIGRAALHPASSSKFLLLSTVNAYPVYFHSSRIVVRVGRA